jgi:hypothetical protein
MSVVNEESGNSRWSLDHLFLDQDAVPTLIEVKRSSNMQIRREVVGQMLDYAANAVAYWPVEEVRSKFQSRCERNDENPEDVFRSSLGAEKDINEFWQRVKTNLQAGRVRMVFVADSIPAELRRIVEFLNEQMDPAEVLAIEVKQFIGTGMRTLVPRVLGQTETARQKKSPRTRAFKEWDEESFFAELEDQQGGAARKAAEDLLHWITPQITYVSWGKGSASCNLTPTIEQGSVTYRVCNMDTKYGFGFRFDDLSKKRPLSDETIRRQLLAQINEIPGISFDEVKMKKGSCTSFAKLATPEAIYRIRIELERIKG